MPRAVSAVLGSGLRGTTWAVAVLYIENIWEIHCSASDVLGEMSVFGKRCLCWHSPLILGEDLVFGSLC